MFVNKYFSSTSINFLHSFILGCLWGFLINFFLSKLSVTEWNYQYNLNPFIEFYKINSILMQADKDLY